jgi:glycosyltransferase involved in cell wall biosynthesis
VTEVASSNRLFFLLPFPPRLDANHGGSKAIAQLLSRLAIRHKLAVVYLRGAGEPPLDEHLRDRLDLAKEVERPWTRDSITAQCVRRTRLGVSLIRRKPIWVADWSSKAYAATVQSLVKRWQPDIVHIAYHVMGQYLPALRDCQAPRILTEYEPGNRAASFITSSGSIAGLLNHVDRKAWKRFEPAVIRQVRAVVVFTESDKQAVESLAPGTRVVRIPLGTELLESPLDPEGSLPRNLLFFGNFIHPPNVDAALRTVRTIFLPLQARFPDLELYLVGDKPPAELKRMANTKIRVTGRVPDLAPYINRASIFIAPLRLGGGMRLKVLEALGAGKAIVASPRALEGLNVVDGETVYIAESDAAFCVAIAELLDHPEKRISIANAARAWACANLTWDRSIGAYEALHAQLVASSQQISLCLDWDKSPSAKPHQEHYTTGIFPTNPSDRGAF